uniref:Ig-like domain-containing protein n=1 Tax=Fundulus heteroclitus TaxID=8078 RepID=A0A3Q2QD51_FUNHE
MSQRWCYGARDVNDLNLDFMSGCGNVSVVGHIGQNVTLNCSYDIKTKTTSVVCWGRGELPNRGCSNQLIGTGDYKGKEETRVSSRYQLLGRLDKGDVSLMIQNLRENDAGRYGCRVGIPGWLNDLKHYVDLTVERVKLYMEFLQPPLIPIPFLVHVVLGDVNIHVDRRNIHPGC